MANFSFEDVRLVIDGVLVCSSDRTYTDPDNLPNGHWANKSYADIVGDMNRLTMAIRPFMVPLDHSFTMPIKFCVDPNLERRRWRERKKRGL